MSDVEPLAGQYFTLERLLVGAMDGQRSGVLGLCGPKPCGGAQMHSAIARPTTIEPLIRAAFVSVNGHQGQAHGRGIEQSCGSAHRLAQ